MLVGSTSKAVSQFWNKSDLGPQWVDEYLKTQPRTGIAFHYGKAAYLGLQDPDAMNQLGGIDYTNESFSALQSVIVEKAQTSEGLKTAKILETGFSDLIKEGERDALIAYMAENQLELLQIVEFSSVFTGIREEGSGMSGKITGYRYGLNIESRFYFRQLLEDKENELAACRADFHWLPLIEGEDHPVSWDVTLNDLLMKPEAKENIPSQLSLKTIARKDFNDVNGRYASLGSTKPAAKNMEGIVLGLEGEQVKISKYVKVMGRLALGGGNYDVIETVNGDNPATFWSEREYKIAVAQLKVVEGIDDYSLCDVTALSGNYSKENMEGLPIAASGKSGLGIAGLTPDISGSMTLAGNRYTLEDIEKMELASQGIAAVDEAYYESKDLLHPSTEMNSTAAPNYIPKKEKRLLAKVRRYESEGHKIAVVVNPGFIMLENPPEPEEESVSGSGETAQISPVSGTSGTKSYSIGSAPQAYSPPPCEFEPGSDVFSDDFLNAAIEITDALNAGFGTDVFVHIDKDKIPVVEKKVFGQVTKSPSLFDTQYKILVMVGLNGSYNVIKAKTSPTSEKEELQMKFELYSDLTVVEFENDKNKQKSVGSARIVLNPPVMKTTDECPATLSDFTEAMGAPDEYLASYRDSRDKSVSGFIKKQSK